jgi:hypothetical protein
MIEQLPVGLGPVGPPAAVPLPVVGALVRAALVLGQRDVSVGSQPPRPIRPRGLGFHRRASLCVTPNARRGVASQVHTPYGRLVPALTVDDRQSLSQPPEACGVKDGHRWWRRPEYFAHERAQPSRLPRG